jgi:ketosteroid isomerase-like protein
MIVPDDNAELARRAIEAYGTGDSDALVSLMDPDVELKSLLTEAENADWHGHAGVRKWMSIVRDFFPELEVPDIGEREEAGGDVITCFEVAAPIGDARMPIRQSFWNLTRVREGRIVWFGFFRTRKEALAAVEAAALGQETT